MKHAQKHLGAISELSCKGEFLILFVMYHPDLIHIFVMYVLADIQKSTTVRKPKPLKRGHEIVQKSTTGNN